MENRKIVLLDDDIVSVLLLDKLIKKWMPEMAVLKFKEAYNCLRAMKEKIEEEKWLIFLDINMPEMNGWGFLEALRDKGLDKNVEVVITTSSIDVRDYGKAFEFPCVKQYLIKPVVAENLEALKESSVVSEYFSRMQ